MPAPKYHTIKQYLYNEIASGRLPEQSKVPSENELCGQFKVSRMTARRALQELTDEGILQRTKGLGTFVAPFKNQGSSLTLENIADDIKRRGFKHKIKLITLEKRQSDAKVSRALCLPVESPVYFAALIHHQNETPVQLETRYVNARLVPRFIEQSFKTQTPHDYLTQALPLTKADHIIEAVMADQQTSKFLKLLAPQACLQITRRCWTSLGIVSYAQLTSPGQHYRIGEPSVSISE